MKTLALAAALAVAAIAAPAFAQAPAASAPAAPAAAAPAGKISVETTPIGDIIKNPDAKATLEKALPEIPQFYDQIATMTLAQVAPMSQGAIDDAKLKALQAEFDKLK
jgi:lipoprotein-anchoring transpeptidase ErfK/SrfK